MQVDTNTDGEVDYYEAYVQSAQDYYPGGSLMPERQYHNGNSYRYGFNGKENDNEVKGEGNQQDYGMRIYDPRLGRFLSVDPISGKYPELTPYQFASNTPIQAIDLDGLEAVYWEKTWGFTTSKPKLKLGEWYEIHSYFLSYVPQRSIDQESFRQAALFNSSLNRSSVYTNIERRHDFYETAQDILNEKNVDSKWFKAAGIVTQWNAVGAADIDVFNYLGTETANFLKEGNSFLFSYNMDNFRELNVNGKIMKSFTSAKQANGKTEKIDMNKLTGKELDYAMVKYEQSLVQEYIEDYQKNHPKANMSAIYKTLSKAFKSSLGPKEIRNVIKAEFTDKGKEFNFQSYDDRVLLGQRLVDSVRKN